MVQGSVLGALDGCQIQQALRRIAELDNRALSPMSKSIPAGDSVELAADVLRTTEDARGTIIFVHGFCGNRAENGMFSSLARSVAAAGFNSIAYDWRGIGDSAGEFTETTLDDHVADFRQVSDWASEYFGDTKPLYAVGFSLGAAVVGRSLQTESRLRQLAYLSPAVRPRESMWPRYNTPEIQTQLEDHGVIQKPGSYQLVGRGMLEALRDTDLGLDAFDPGIPLLVCHGTGDTRVECWHSRELVTHRRELRDFGYLEIKDASHSFRPGESHWDVVAATIATWFRRGPNTKSESIADGTHTAESALRSIHH